MSLYEELYRSILPPISPINVMKCEILINLHFTYQYNSNLGCINLKISIGYLLKSAEVRTLVSRRYSENSSHTYPCKPMCTRIHLKTPKHTHAHPTPGVYISHSAVIIITAKFWNLADIQKSFDDFFKNSQILTLAKHKT